MNSETLNTETLNSETLNSETPNTETLNTETLENETMEAENPTDTQSEASESNAEFAANSAPADNPEANASELDTLKAQLAEAQDRNLRLQAEFENYRKRTAAERERLLQQGAEGLLLPLLPVLDDIERALRLIDNTAELEPEKLVAGIRLVQKNYLKAFEKLGIEQLQPEGKPFDSAYHEAIAKQPVENETQKGQVLHAVSPGYVFHGRVIRFAQVVVGE
jgi:molecular chaperone GrpE